MVRDDDFGEVPNLGPARDEMDQPPVRQQAARKPIPEAPQTARPAPAAKPSSGGRNGFVYLLLLLVIVAAAGFGYWSFERQATLEARLLTLQQEQQVSGQKIAALEGLISATDESVSKSGAALQAQVKQLVQEQSGRVKHVDSEIAKLWTIAHQRNRPKLEALEKSVGGMEKSFKSFGSGLDKLQNNVAGQQKVLADTGAALNKLTTAQARQLDEHHQLADQLRIRDQANQELDELQDVQLKQLSDELMALKQNPQIPAEVAQQLDDHGRTIESINAFRKQINQELLRLRERINKVQLSVSPKPAS